MDRVQALQRLLVCPECGGDLKWTAASADCLRCDARHPLEQGVPVLLPRSAMTAYKRRQASTHDEHWTPDFEVTRPRGAPLFYGLLMEEKFARSVSRLSPLLPGSTAVTVCGGSGMDAELLARAGAAVLATDISLGTCLRARRRGAESGLPILPVVADAERLPLRDRSVTLAYVHDGLHHLEDPFDGLAEMARVADRGLSLTEPARAALTTLAVRVGRAEEHEDAGNRINRLAPGIVAARLAAWGWTPVDARRYGMFYQHDPGAAARLLSRRRLAHPALRALRGLNAVAGGLGNKLSVQAVRD